MKNNKTLLQKADLEVSDLIGDGGYLQEEQANKFIVDLIKEAKILSMVTVQGLKSHTKLIDKIGISGRVLHPGTTGTALSVDNRTKPTTDQITLSTKLMKGELRLNDETLEDNIEQGTFKNTIMNMMKEQVALDIDELVVNGNTSSTDDFLAQFNGMIALATSNTVAAGGVAISKSHLKSALKALPKQYHRLKSQQRWLTSDNVELDYRDYLADRATVLGDEMVKGTMPVTYGGRPMEPIPTFPEDLGSGSDESVVVLTHPKNLIVGFWRRVKIQTDMDIRTGQFIIVPSLRVGCQYQEEEAVVKITGVLAS